MMDKSSDSKRKGIIGTGAFHLIVLIIFMFTGLTMPNPLPDEEGMPIELDLGNTDFGSGDMQPESIEPQDITEPVSEPFENTPVEAVEEMATQNTESEIAAPKEVTEERSKKRNLN